MNDATDPSPRSWLERLGELLLREPKDREELIEVLRDANDRALLDSNALAMIEGVLQVSRLQVRDIMIPRANMVIVNIDDPIQHILKKVIETSHSRFPVIGDSKDEILGILLAKDLLPLALEDKPTLNLKELLRSAEFIPESKRLNILLDDYRHKHNHMAVVVDEYGGISGLITIEDVLEQIVGDIEDESDSQDEDIHIKALGDNIYTIKALTPVEEFNTYFNTQYSNDEFDTIGGLVIHEFGHMPEPREVVMLDDFEFTVLRADRRRVHLLEMKVFT